MRILIDGYNMIRSIPELREADRTDLQQGRDMFLDSLSPYRAGKGHRITVIFDGAEAIHLNGGRERVGGIMVRFSPRGVSADSIILESMKNNNTDVLISADRELADAASRCGVTTVSPELFWDRVQEEMIRRMKGEEEEVERGRWKGNKGRKLSKTERRDRGRIEKL